MHIHASQGPRSIALYSHSAPFSTSTSPCSFTVEALNVSAALADLTDERQMQAGQCVCVCVCVSRGCRDHLKISFSSGHAEIMDYK